MFRRFVWSATGVFFTVIGLAGLILPIIPGILFLLLAAYCFSKAAAPDPQPVPHWRDYEDLRDDFRNDMKTRYRGYRQYRANRHSRNMGYYSRH